MFRGFSRALAWVCGGVWTLASCTSPAPDPGLASGAEAGGHAVSLGVGASLAGAAGGAGMAGSNGLPSADGGVSTDDTSNLPRDPRTGCRLTKSPVTFPVDGACDASEPRKIGQIGDPLPEGAGYFVTCDSQPLTAAASCVGLPNDIFGACSLRRCEATHSYPQGCRLLLPSENPSYAGAPQVCDCIWDEWVGKVWWSCGI
jgi:hypothetical protein